MKEYIEKLVKREQETHSRVVSLRKKYGDTLTEAEKHVDYNEAAYEWIDVRNQLKELKKSIERDYEEIMKLFDEMTY